jgi:2-phospho-L-lactate guanylyltransferase
VTVAHGDLPRAHGLGTLAPFEGATLVPDRRDDGTNVLRLPADADFRFAYGPGSFRAHRAEATRLGLPVRVLREPNLAYDVDWPADVVELSRPS